jgi:CDGSH-type Zn-finger protein
MKVGPGGSGAAGPDEQPKPVVITIKPSGSISIEGDVVLQDRDGNPIPRPTEKHPGILKLCGCGHSKTPPFCDGTHNESKAGTPPAR